MADELALVACDVVVVSAENAAGSVLSENDVVIVHKDLYGIKIIDLKSVAQLLRDNDSSELVDFSYNAGLIHLCLPPIFKRW